MTHAELLKAKGQCPDCDGRGRSRKKIILEGRDCFHLVICLTCTGTGNAIVEEVIPIDVPDGYGYSWLRCETSLYVYFVKFDGTCPECLEIKPPYTLGETKTFACDRCEGEQIERYPEPFGLCKKCKGISSEITATVQSIEVKDNNFIVRWL